MKSELSTEIASAINRDASLDELVGILRAYQRNGMTAKSAGETLEAMRIATSPGTEDRILEILDIVAGFCRPELRVWDEGMN